MRRRDFEGDVGDFRSRLEKDTRFDYFRTTCAKFVFVTLFVVNTVACIYYWLAVNHTDKDNTWLGQTMEHFEDRSIWLCYTYAEYWTITTLTMVGYGNFYPRNTGEKVISIFFMLFSICFVNYVTTSLSKLLEQKATRTQAMRENIRDFSRYATKNMLPEALTEEVIAHRQLKYKSVQLQEEELLAELPNALRTRITKQIFLEIVQSTYLFKEIPQDFIIQLISEMNAEYFPPEADIILEHEISTDFFIIVSGEVDVLTNSNGSEKYLESFGRGGMVGEIGVMLNIPQPFTVRCRRLSQVLRIGHQHFRLVVQLYEKNGLIMNSILFQFLEGFKKEVLKEIPFMVELQNNMNEHLRPAMRVVIHGHHPHEAPTDKRFSFGVLVSLPDSMEELFKLAEREFGKAANRLCIQDSYSSYVDYLLVDDLRVVRDNEHLFIFWEDEI